MTDWLRIGFVGITVIHGLWLIRLGKFRLATRYPILTAYLVFSVLASLMLVLSSEGLAYGVIWALSRPVYWVLMLAIMIEVYNRMLVGYPGLQRLGKIALYTTLSAVGAVVLGLAVFEPAENAPLWLALWVRHETAVYVALALLSALLAVFGWYFRIALPPNVRTAFVAFGVVFVSEAGLRAVQAHAGSDIETARNMLMLVTYLAVIGIAALKFSPDGDVVPPRASLGQEAGLHQERFLVRHLQSVNHSLLKVLRP